MSTLKPPRAVLDSTHIVVLAVSGVGRVLAETRRARTGPEVLEVHALRRAARRRPRRLLISEQGMLGVGGHAFGPRKVVAFEDFARSEICN